MLNVSIALVSCCLLAATAIASAQTGQSSNHSETVECGSITQAEIFRRARLSILTNNPNSKILLADKESGDLISQGTCYITIPRTAPSGAGSYQLRYALAVECVNRKYRAHVSGIELADVGKQTPFESLSENTQKVLLPELDGHIKTLLQTLQQGIKDYKPF